jgi:vacuolar-type H+-ATPase subunit E/Vma4
MTPKDQETALVSSIEKQAHDEAQKIVESAHQGVAERKKSIEAQLARIKKENAEKEQQQLAAVAKQGEQKIASLERKQMLEIKEYVVEHVIDHVKDKFIDLSKQSDFKDTLIDWTVEAALGLQDKDPILKVTQSCASFADEAFCIEAASRYKKITGEDITFTLSADSLTKGHGIILEAQNGKTAYNNLLENRLYRYKDTIEALVLEDIFDE